MVRRVGRLRRSTAGCSVGNRRFVGCADRRTSIGSCRTTSREHRHHRDHDHKDHRTAADRQQGQQPALHLDRAIADVRTGQGSGSRRRPAGSRKLLVEQACLRNQQRSPAAGAIHLLSGQCVGCTKLLSARTSNKWHRIVIQYADRQQPPQILRSRYPPVRRHRRSRRCECRCDPPAPGSRGFRCGRFARRGSSR